GETCEGIAINNSTGQYDYLELAHFTGRNYGRAGTASSDPAGFIRFTDNAGSAEYLYLHDLLIENNCRGRPSSNPANNASCRTFSMSTSPSALRYLAIINVNVQNWGAWVARGGAGQGAESGPYRFQHITAVAQGLTGGNVTAFKMWEFVTGIEFLDNYIDSNGNAWGIGTGGGQTSHGYNVEQCTRDIDIVNNTFKDWRTSVYIQPNAPGPGDCTARNIGDVRIDRNVMLNSVAGWQDNATGLLINSGSNTVETLHFTNNMIWSSQPVYSCIRSLASSSQQAIEQNNPIEIVGNTCFLNENGVGSIAIRRGGGTYPRQNYVIRNNAVSGLASGRIDISTSYVPSGWSADGNVYDPDGVYVWNGTTQTTLTGWRSASGGDANSRECTPTFVNSASGDLHLMSTDTCALDTGVDVSTITTVDLDTDPRPQGSGWDAGADEVGSSGPQAETLFVSLAAAPSSGTSPLNGVDFTATVAGTATGPMTYTFYCHRPDTGTNVTLPYDAQVSGTSANPYTAIDLCSYTTAGPYTAKVIVERGTISLAQAAVAIQVSAPVTIPAAPSNLVGTKSSLQNVLSWTDNSSDEQGFRLSRDGSVRTTLAANQTSYTDNPGASAPFGQALISSQDFNVDGTGSVLDQVAFWVAPNPAESLMFVTAKSSASVEVWRHPFTPGNQITSITQGLQRPNGVHVDQEDNLLYVTNRGTQAAVLVYQLAAGTSAFPLVRMIGQGDYSTDSAAGPMEVHTARVGGEKRVYVFEEQPGEAFVYRTDGTRLLGPVDLPGVASLEAFALDEFHQRIYVADQTGFQARLFDMNLQPLNVPGRTDNIISNTVFQGEPEGTQLYDCGNGQGFLIHTDQQTSTSHFEVFDRATLQHLGLFEMSGVNNTDGIAILGTPLPNYPSGLFAAIDNDVSTVGVHWSSLLSATGLSCPAATSGSHTYTVTAYNSAGESAPSNLVTCDDVSCTAGSSTDTEPPTLLSNLTLSALSSTSLTASWTAATDNIAVMGYRLDLSTMSSFSSFVTGYDNRDVGNVTTTQLTGLLAGTTYYLRSRAYDAAGNTSANSATANGTTPAPPPDTTAPTVSLTAPVAGSTVSSTITVSATASDNVGVVGVQFLL
ncbi:MAG: phytase, partial [Nitrospirae bacterium]|nr:phytase [Nitrospirota bacterium]